MTLRACIFQLCCLSVVLGGLTDNADVKCITTCYQEVQSYNKYCFVECVTEKSQSSKDIIKNIKFNPFQGYSGYAAVAAKIRFYKHQREHSLQRTSEQLTISESNETAEWAGILYRLSFVVVIFIIVCSTMTGTIDTIDQLFRVAVSAFNQIR